MGRGRKYNWFVDLKKKKKECSDKEKEEDKVRMKAVTNEEKEGRDGG